MWQIYEFIKAYPGITIIGAVTLIQIAPIKIDPWSALIRWIRKIFIGDLDGKMDKIALKVESLENKVEENEAILARTHILRFNDELYNGIKHSRDYFEQQLDDCARYEEYCEAHPQFRNGRTAMATQNIKEAYQKLFEEHKFL